MNHRAPAIPPLAAALVAVLASPLAAQDPAELSVCGGSLGQNLRVDLRSGPANGIGLIATGLDRAVVPLSLLDPADSRSVGVMPDLVRFVVLDPAGTAGFDLPIPSNPILAGFALLQQAITGPGSNRLIDEVTELVVSPIEAGGAFAPVAATMANQRAFATPIPLAGGEVLIVGGGSGTLLFQNGTDQTEIWDPATRALRPGPTMTAARSAHTQTLLQDGRYLVTGGLDATSVVLASCEVFDPATNTFAAVAPMSAVRSHHTATLLADGRVLVAGGLQVLTDVTSAVTSGVNSTEIYNPVTNSWTNGPTLARPRGGHMAVLLDDGRVLVCGGISYTIFFGQRSPNLQRRADLINPTNNTSTPGPSMATSRAFAGTFKLPDGRAMMVGGLTGDITSGGAATGLCEAFNPTTNSWDAIAPLPTAAALPACITLADDTLVALGGAGNSLLAPLPLAATASFDPTTLSWSPLPPLSTARAAAAPVALQSCGIASIGGTTTIQATSTDTLEILIR